MSNMIDTSIVEYFYTEWKRMQQRNRRHATIKGIPVAGTGKRTNMGSFRSSAGGNNGVSAGERHFHHRYMDEHDKGPSYRREIRRSGNAMWRREWAEEQFSEWEELAAFDSFE